MSYVDLKHLLADLALEAVRAPSRATWLHPLIAYAAAATPDASVVPLRRTAGLDRLIDAGLLEGRNGRVTCRSAFLPHLPYLQRQTARLAAALESLKSSRRPAGIPTDLVLGAALFNAGLYFETHELLELTWRATEGPERDFYHGIVQAAAAFYHFEKQNLNGARTLLAKSLRRLSPYPSPFLGVRLASLKTSLERWREYFAVLPDTTARRPPKPTIRF